MIDETPSDEPQAVTLQGRLDLLMRRADSEALGLTRGLVQDIRQAGDSLLPEALLLLARRARELPDFEEALAAATEAWEHSQDPGQRDRALRARGAALLGLRRVGEALEVLDGALVRRGPLFGGGGSFSFRAPTDPMDEVLDEAASIASWASARTPEWVRALGGMAEHLDLPELHERFEQGLRTLAAQEPDKAARDLEVVLRHASQRSLHTTAAAAALHLADLARTCDEELLPDLLDALHEAAPRDVHPLSTALLQRPLPTDPEDLLRLRAKAAAGDPEPLPAMWDLFLDLRAEPALLSETDTGHAFADALVDTLVATGDHRALDVAATLYEAKVCRWGEDVPAAWLELQNIGTTYARLGQPVPARKALTSALEGLLRHADEDHPRVRIVKQNLARLDENHEP